MLFVIGSMSEYFRNISEHLKKTYTGKVFVCEKMSFWAGSGLISEEKMTIIGDIPGIKDVIPLLIGKIDPEEVFALGMPNVLIGVPVEKAHLLLQNAPLQEGQWFLRDDSDGVVVGYDIASQYALQPGREITIRGKRFPVRGILEKTGTLEDRQAFMPLAEAQEVLLRPHLLTCIVLIPEDAGHIHTIAYSIKEKIPWLMAVTSEKIEDEVKRNIVYWELLTAICIMLSGMASFLSVAVIMVMSVSERSKEIGLKKALGAENIHIYLEYLAEVALLCVLGWALGVLLGEGFISFYHHCYRESHISIFLVTPRLVAGSLLWALFIGIISSSFPARQAMNIEPVKSLRQV